MRLALIQASGNTKTGPIPVSTSPGSSCPPSCALWDVCYARFGRIGIWWRYLDEAPDHFIRTYTWREFCHAIKALPVGALWRHNQAGDLAGTGEAINADQLAQLTRANRHRRGFTFTHKHQGDGNQAAIAAANAGGFIINLSAHTLEEADQLADLKIGPVVVGIPDKTKIRHTPAGRRVVTCPNHYNKAITCQRCQLCQRVDRDYLIGFPPIGARRKRARVIFEGGQPAA